MELCFKARVWDQIRFIKKKTQLRLTVVEGYSEEERSRYLNEC